MDELGPRSERWPGLPADVVVTVKKARLGWWVDGRWCPTREIRDHEIRRIRRERHPAMVYVRTPG